MKSERYSKVIMRSSSSYAPFLLLFPPSSSSSSVDQRRRGALALPSGRAAECTRLSFSFIRNITLLMQSFIQQMLYALLLESHLLIYFIIFNSHFQQSVLKRRYKMAVRAESKNGRPVICNILSFGDHFIFHLLNC